jgi:hypothetical protein
LFYIKNNIDVYRLIIKDVDLEKKPRWMNEKEKYS